MSSWFGLSEFKHLFAKLERERILAHGSERPEHLEPAATSGQLLRHHGRSASAGEPRGRYVS